MVPRNLDDQQEFKKIQEKAVKMVKGLKGETYEEKFKELGLEILKERWAQKDLMLTHKFFARDIADHHLFRRTANQTG
jgi:hypothetical protein